MGSGSEALRPLRGVALFLLVASLAGTAHAQVSHRIRFAAGPVVHVWEAAAPAGKGSSVHLESASGATQATGSAPVLTGTLIPVRSRLAPHQPRRFSIASNSGFRIAVACPASAQAGEIALSVTGAGPSARLPGPAAMAESTRAGRPAALHYTAPRRTAARPGAPRDQAVTFELTSRDGAPPPADCSVTINAHE